MVNKVTFFRLKDDRPNHPLLDPSLEEARETTLDLLSKYLFILKFRFGVMFCSILGNKNSATGHIQMVSQAACGPRIGGSHH